MESCFATTVAVALSRDAALIFRSLRQRRDAHLAKSSRLLSTKTCFIEASPSHTDLATVDTDCVVIQRERLSVADDEDYGTPDHSPPHRQLVRHAVLAQHLEGTSCRHAWQHKTPAPKARTHQWKRLSPSVVDEESHG